MPPFRCGNHGGSNGFTLDQNIRKIKNVSNDILSVICTDHLSTANRSTRAQKHGVSTVPAQAPSRHELKWLNVALKTHPYITLQHEKAHTGAQSKSAQMNEAADRAAKAARDSDIQIGPPLSVMDRYPLQSDLIGISHTHVPTLLQHLWDVKREPNLHQSTEDKSEYFGKYLFLMAKSAFGAQTQLQIRSSKLPTVKRNLDMKLDGTHPRTKCKRCNLAAELVAEDHVFLRCPGSLQMIGSSAKDAEKQVRNYLDYNKATADKYERHIKLAKTLHADNDMWATGKSLYW